MVSWLLPQLNLNLRFGSRKRETWGELAGSTGPVIAHLASMAYMQITSPRFRLPDSDTSHLLVGDSLQLAIFTRGQASQGRSHRIIAGSTDRLIDTSDRAIRCSL
jgi:hypothetical protein